LAKKFSRPILRFFKQTLRQNFWRYKKVIYLKLLVIKKSNVILLQIWSVLSYYMQDAAKAGAAAK
jgi:hypothetical protein